MRQWKENNFTNNKIGLQISSEGKWENKKISKKVSEKKINLKSGNKCQQVVLRQWHENKFTNFQIRGHIVE